MNDDRDRFRKLPVGQLAPRTVVGNYTVIEKLDGAGVGEVYLADDNRLNRPVAIKFVPARLASDDVAKGRFVREAEAAAALTHPNIIHLYEICEYYGQPFLVMEKPRGQPLRVVMTERHEEFSLPRVMDLAVQICEALNAAHKKSVIHRGLNPGCILLDRNGWIQLIDFGLAVVAREKPGGGADETGGLYLAPEQVRGMSVDNRCDIFSFGVILYELLTGAHPFARDNAAAVSRAIVEDTPAPLNSHVADLPGELQAIIDRTLAKEAAARYQYVDDLLADLKRERAMRLVRDSEARYRSLNDDILDSSWEGICILDSEFRIVWMNRALERYFGIRREDVFGSESRHFVDYYLRPILENPDTVVEKIRATYSHDAGVEHLECHVLSDKRREERWLEYWSQPINSGIYAGGRIEHYYDISESKQAHDVQRQSEEKLRQIIDLVPHMIFAKDREGRFLLANRTLAEMYDTTVEKLAQQRHRDIHGVGLELDRMLADDMEVIDSGHPKFIPEESFTDTKGRTYILQTTKIPYTEAGSNEAAMLGVAIDITEQKKAESKLRESRRALATLMGNLPGIAYRCTNDPEWTMEFISQGCRELTGYDVDELQHNKLLSYARIIHPDDRQEVWNDVQTALDNKKPFRLNYRILTRDNEVRWVWEQGSGVRDASGNVVALEGFITDVTERHLADKRLRDAEAEKAIILNSVTENVTYQDHDLRVIWANRAAAESVGVSSEELVGRHCYEIWHGRNVPCPDCPVERAINTGQRHETEITGADGRVWAVHGFPVRNEAGEVIGAVEVTGDITERKRVQAALHEAEKKTQLAFHHAPFGIVILSLDGRFLQVNWAFYRMLGYTEVELSSLTWEDITDPENHDEEKIAIEQCRRGEIDQYRLEKKFVTRKGETLWVNYVAVVIGDEQGDPLYILGMMEDITERKHQDEKLRETTEQLKTERGILSEKNIALKQVLDRLGEDRREFKDLICREIQGSIMPVVRRLRGEVGEVGENALQALEDDVNRILSKDIDVFRDRYARLTSRESEICEMIKSGMSSKEISEDLNLSIMTVQKHRERIRKKLGITNKSLNLATYLRSR